MILIITIGLSVFGCGGSADTGNVERTTVVAGFYPLAYAAQHIGGEAVDVRNLTPTGSEPPTSSCPGMSGTSTMPT